MSDVPDAFEVRAIGHVRRPGAADDPRHLDPDQPCELAILPRYAGGLAGIEGYSHLVVLCLFDRAARPDRLDGPVHPEGRDDVPAVGLFATRSPFRPNPIAVSFPRLLRRDGDVLTVTGMDAWDGTPILDLKGYIPRGDAHPDATIPPWLEALQRRHDEERGGRREAGDGRSDEGQDSGPTA